MMMEMSVYSVGIIPVSESRSGEYLYLVAKHRAGHWAFPKGTPEEGESEIKTAKRELYEETGIKNVDVRTERKFVQNYSFIEGNIQKHKSVTYYIGLTSDIRAETPEEFKNEILEIQWLPYDTVRELLTYRESKDLHDEVNTYLHTTYS